jgi:hypothetical protein
MERNVTNPFTEYGIQPSRRPSHNQAPTRLELQRWEDDGGAVRAEPSSRRAERHDRGWPAELAAAE